MTDTIRLLIVDDHLSFAESLEAVLQRYPDIQVVGTARSVREAIERAAELRPRVILMDQRLPDGSGADAARRVLAAGTGTAVIMLTGGGSDDAEMRVAIEAGASAYLLKTGRVHEIVDAVRRAATGAPL